MDITTFSAQIAGNNVTLNAPLSFKSGFVGNQDVWDYASNYSNDVNSGWQKMGNWAVSVSSCNGQNGTVTLGQSPIEVGGSTTATIPGWTGPFTFFRDSSIATANSTTVTAVAGGTATISGSGTAPNGVTCSTTTNAPVI